MTKRNQRISILILVAALAISGFFIYKMLFPGGPVLTTVPNSISDKATLSKGLNESEIPTNPLKNVYFGDLHVHTCYSFDAYIGGANTTPDEAYRFAKGEKINIFEQDVQIQRPLDFAAVTDHSEFMGELYSIQTKGAPAYRSLVVQYIRSIGLDTSKQREFFKRAGRRVGAKKRSHMPFFQGFETTKSAWNVTLQAAEQHYQPGKFTTFAAYEWTLSGLTSGQLGAHLHRNIFFRDMMVPDYPMSAIELTNAEELWEYLDRITEEGATVMAVPHNTNLSDGQSFPEVDREGKPLGKAYVESSNRHEPLFEIHQAKGNSEVHAAFWPNDEFADFENYSIDPPKQNNYGRDALKRGLAYEANLGTNPFKFGIIASTDTHNGIPGNTEEKGAFIGYKDGKLEEKIFNVALSDNRILNPDGTVPDNGATVNMQTGAWSEDKGAVELKTIWTDPEFDPEAKAFYYVRVLELPTPHWRLWDKIRYGSNFPEALPLTIRERAWSSPIWY